MYLQVPYLFLLAAKDYQLFGNGKKILLFDIKDDEVLKRNDAIEFINVLAEWDRARVAYASQVGAEDNRDHKKDVPNLCC